MAGILNRLLGQLGGGKRAGTHYTVADVYHRLRQQVLTVNPGAIGLDASSSIRVWGILMETGYPEAVATLVAMADGTVSLYFSNGGGIIGVGQHEGPRKAALDLLSAAPAFLPQTRKTTDYPLPEEGHTRFYFMTFDGVFTADAVEADLGNNRHAFASLFHRAHAVITQARSVEEKCREAAARMLHAASTGDTRALRSLLDSGVPPHVVDDTGLTPLMAASYSGMTEAQELLLDSGAQIDAVDSSGYTALMFACNAGKTDCARLLVTRGADVNHRDKSSSTPIMFAAQHAHNEIVRILLARGADPHIKGTHGLSAIGLAQQNGHAVTERILKSSE